MLPAIFGVTIVSCSAFLSSSHAASVTVKTPQQQGSYQVSNIERAIIPSNGVHIVQDGETLFGIARSYGISYASIAENNTLNPDGSIRIGQKIKIPENAIGTVSVQNLAKNDQKKQIQPQPPIKEIPYNNTHIVNYGETIFGIARSYGISPIDFATENEFELSHIIKIGEKLKIPKRNEVQNQIQPLEKPNKKEERRASVIEKAPLISPLINKANTKECELEFTWPIASTKIIKKYGEILKSGTKNDGIILASELGKSIIASHAGEIVYAGDDIPEYGNLMIIKHKGNWMTIYGYMKSFSKKTGDKVSKGEEIGKTGESGDATAPSIYFSIRKVKTPHNPELCI